MRTWTLISTYLSSGVFGVSEKTGPSGLPEEARGSTVLIGIMSLYLSALGSGKAKMQASEVISFSENFVLGLRPSSWDYGPESILLSWIHLQPQGASEGGRRPERMDWA